jgi:uncharacterized NAD(P)/FAD-binding protein YdhS
MDALDGGQGEFAAWLGDGHSAESFAERRVFGRYLSELLDQAREQHGERLRTVHGEAVAIEPGGSVLLSTGEAVSADAVVLALGNLPPEAPRQIPADLDGALYVPNPWAPGLADGLAPGDTVLLIGTGLTAIDAALSLDSAGFAGTVLAVSRRGLVPRGHAERPLPPASTPAGLQPQCSSLLSAVRRSAENRDWRQAVDAMRPVTQQLWAAASVAERRRFLRHLRPWWDVHRHRIAPQIAARIEGMREDGRLLVAAGRLLSIEEASRAGATLVWRPRGLPEAERRRVRRIVNCTGPRMNISGADDALLRSLLDEGRIRPDPCRIGIDVDSVCRVLDRDGQPAETLFAIGPMTRGRFWEVVAVPDIRVQVKALAVRLTAATCAGTVATGP